MRSQLILLILVVGYFITDLHQCALGCLQSESVLLVDLYFLLECSLNNSELPLDHLVLSHDLAVITS
jgi:hypothetical protein